MLIEWLTPEIQLKQIGDYIVEKALGRGSFGYVMLAKHNITQQNVAIKILEKSKIDQNSQVQVLREIKELKMLSHSNIIKLYEVFDTPDYICLVTEYAEHGQLLDYVSKKEKLEEAEACHLFRQIVSAIMYCHSRKVCHRDLKLENILLSDQNQIKIIDFGVCNILMTQESKFKTACGSPYYIAPEILSRSPYEGCPVDVWSSGVALFVLLCGRLPFKASQPDVLFKRIKSGNFIIPQHVSPDAQELLKKILVVDPIKRAKFEDIIQDPWFLQAHSEQFVREDTTEQIKSIDLKIILGMEKAMQWPAKQIVRALQLNFHNQLTSTYYLLREKKQKQGDKETTQEEQAALQKLMQIDSFEIGLQQNDTLESIEWK